MRERPQNATRPPRLVFTVTNQLVYDQRMIRICGSLSRAGYRVKLVGCRHAGATELVEEPFEQVRLRCFFRKGFGFYAEYNLRLFFYLLFCRMDLVCAIDLDTILPCYLVSFLRGKKRVYDAHELFCEMQEIVQRPRVYRFWKRLEKYTVPHFKIGYTVNQPIADEFHRMYGVQYEVVRNLPQLRELNIPSTKDKYILYQGAVNHGRSFETLIPAMKEVPVPLWIAGDGNFIQQAKALVKEHGLENKVKFLGKIAPRQLWDITQHAWFGITLFEATGKSNYYSLANRFFDYIQAGIPQVCVDYPVYRELNNSGAVALLTGDLSPQGLSAAMNKLLMDKELYTALQTRCLEKRQQWNWQEEEKILLKIYHSLFTL